MTPPYSPIHAPRGNVTNCQGMDSGSGETDVDE